jgi:GT2 family glycosyltransferase
LVDSGLMVSFIIVNWNTRDLLLDSIRSIYETVSLPFEIWVIDNGSSDGSLDALALEIRERNFQEVKIIQNGRNLGFARANNLALKKASARYLVLLNTDTVLAPRSIEEIISFMESCPQAAVCGGQLLNRDGTRQNSIAPFPGLLTELTNKSILRRLMPRRYPGKEVVFNGPVEVDTVIGACMAVRKATMDKVGVLDEEFFFFFEETDWCARFKKNGWKIYHHPKALIYHLQGRSAEKDPRRARVEYWRSRYIYFRKHRGRAARAVLAAGLFLRLVIDTLLNFSYLAVTAFFSERARRKFRLCSYLLSWHLMGRPRGWGLGGNE